MVVPGEYIGQRQVSLDVLPSRVAYLIRSGSRPGFRQAACEASTRWAGRSEPIVPVSPQGRIQPGWRQIVEFLDLDAAVGVGLDSGPAQKAAGDLGLPYVPFERIDHGALPSSSLHPLAVGNRIGQTELVLPTTSQLWEVTAAGDLDEEHLAEWTANDVPVHRASSAEELACAELAGATAIAFSMRGFTENFAAGGFNGPVYLHFTKSNSLRDALWFWNARALTAPPSATPMFLLPPVVDSWLKFRNQLHALLKEQPEMTPDVVLTSLTLDKSELQTIAAFLGLRSERSRKLTTRTLGPPRDNQRALSFWINADPLPWLLYKRRYGTRVHSIAHIFEQEKTTLDFPSPIPFFGHGLVRARVSGLVSSAVPERSAVAELFVPNANWRHGSLEFRTYADTQYRFTVLIPTPDRILRAAIGQPFTPSDKGKYALALQDLVDPTHLLDPGMFEAIRALTTPRSKELLRELARASSDDTTDERLVEIASEWGGRVQQRMWTAAQVAGKERLSVSVISKALERLASIGLATRGLEIACRNCGITSFVLLRDTSDAAICLGCRSQQDYSLDHHLLKIVYRLNSLVDRASDNGVIGHILAVGALRKRDPNTYLVPGVNFDPTNHRNFELDLLGYQGKKVIAGEVKLSANQFTNIPRDIALSKSVGADTHIIACTDELPTYTRELATDLANQSRLELLVLDRSELRPTSA